MTHEQLEEATKHGTGELKITQEDWDRIVQDARNADKFTPTSWINDVVDGYMHCGSYNGVHIEVKVN